MCGLFNHTPAPTNPLCTKISTATNKKNAQIHLHTLSKLHGNHRGLSLSKQLLKRLQDRATRINRQNIQTTSKFLKVLMCKFITSSVQMFLKCRVLTRVQMCLEEVHSIIQNRIQFILKQQPLHYIVNDIRCIVVLNFTYKNGNLSFKDH